jgi:hypothetical protein
VLEKGVPSRSLGSSQHMSQLVRRLPVIPSANPPPLAALTSAFDPLQTLALWRAGTGARGAVSVGGAILDGAGAILTVAGSVRSPAHCGTVASIRNRRSRPRTFGTRTRERRWNLRR